MAGSRTPVFALLRRAIATSMAAGRSGLPLDEFIDATVERRNGRRQFLRQAGAGLGGLALAACGALPKQTVPIANDREVVIVGAGVAGLTAAWRLRQAGVRVRIHEANSRVGGRVYSLRDHFPDGQVVELGGELIDTSHVRIQALCREFGLALDDLLAEGKGLTPETWYFNGQARSEHDLVEALTPLAQALQRDQARLPDDDVTWRTPHDLHDLDRLTLSQWLDKAGLDGWLRSLIDVAYTTEMGAEPALQSALNLIDFISVDRHFSIFGDSDERFHVRGGNDLIVKALARELDDVIETGSVLEALREKAAGGYTLTLRRDGASRDIDADIVVLALPFTTLRRVRMDVALPEAKRRAIDELGYGNNAKLMIGFNRRVWRDHGSTGSLFTDLRCQSTWDTSRAQPGQSGILTNFTGGQHAREIGSGPAKIQADLAVQDLEHIYPGVAAAREGAREVRFHWPSQPWVMGSYACYAPGQWTTLRGAAGERVGGLLFAGEHCALDNQGFIEGACETGEEAAAEAMALLGLTTAMRTALSIRTRNRAMPVTGSARI